MLYYIHTYGCQMNVRDSEAVGALLEASGHEAANNEDEADIVIVNTCSVREKAEDKALGKLGLLCSTKREHPSRVIGVMGCMAQRLGKDIFKRIPTLDFSVGSRATALVPAVIGRILAGEGPVWECGSASVASDPCGNATRTDVVAAHGPGQMLAFVTILLGCERRCAYCIVPEVRGAEYSRPAADVLKEVNAVTDAGAKDVTLLGQSVMRYGMKGGVWPEGGQSPMGLTEPLPRLFEAIASSCPSLQFLRFTSGHPSGVTKELVRAMAELPVMAHHLHLPVQSGSDRILSAMGRGYTRSKFLEVVATLRDAIPDIAITTDVIVGFPGETDADFEATRTLLDEAMIDNTFVFKYSPRPGTRAAAMKDDVSADEKLRRNHVLLEAQDIRGQKLNERFVGSTVKVLAEGPSLRNPDRWSGRCGQNKIVIFRPEHGISRGEMIDVKIAKAHPQTLFGDV